LIKLGRGHFLQCRNSVGKIVSLGAIDLTDGGAIAFTSISLHGLVQFKCRAIG
jgi:hypothetical protein